MSKWEIFLEELRKSSMVAFCMVAFLASIFATGGVIVLSAVNIAPLIGDVAAFVVGIVLAASMWIVVISYINSMERWK